MSRSHIGQRDRRLAISDYVYRILVNFCITFPFSVFGFSSVTWELLWDIFLFFLFVCTFERDCVRHIGLFTTVANYLFFCPQELFCVA